METGITLFKIRWSHWFYYVGVVNTYYTYLSLDLISESVYKRRLKGSLLQFLFLCGKVSISLQACYADSGLPLKLLDIVLFFMFPCESENICFLFPQGTFLQ